jgi:hypothetical protein
MVIQASLTTYVPSITLGMLESCQYDIVYFLIYYE